MVVDSGSPWALISHLGSRVNKDLMFVVVHMVVNACILTWCKISLFSLVNIFSRLLCSLFSLMHTPNHRSTLGSSAGLQRNCVLLLISTHSINHSLRYFLPQDDDMWWKLKIPQEFNRLATNFWASNTTKMIELSILERWSLCYGHGWLVWVDWIAPGFTTQCFLSFPVCMCFFIILLYVYK